MVCRGFISTGVRINGVGHLSFHYDPEVSLGTGYQELCG